MKEIKEIPVEVEGAGVTPQVKNILSKVLGIAQVVFSESKELPPVFFFGDANTGNFSLIETIFDNDHAKDTFTSFAKDVCKKNRASFALFVSESWSLAQIKPEDYDEWLLANPGKNISEHKDAKEIVMVMLETLHGTWLAAIGIGVDENGDKYLNLSEVKFSKTQTGGRMANFLPIKAVNN